MYEAAFRHPNRVIVSRLFIHSRRWDWSDVADVQHLEYGNGQASPDSFGTRADFHSAEHTARDECSAGDDDSVRSRVAVSYKDAITAANTALAADSKTRFIGYGLRMGRAYGTLANVKESQIIETPVAENLMVGLAIGLSLKGYRPIIFFERFDFICNALDAIVNHLDKVHDLSHGEFSPAVIIRAVIGNRIKPLRTGIVHTQDFTAAMKKLVRFPVIKISDETAVVNAYTQATLDQRKGISTLLIEHKDLF